MSDKFKWDKLLSEKRKVSKHREEKNKADRRSSFQDDYDRIVFSSSLRRLQDKAQVFPLEKHDFVRTRLTHSLEVSTLGKSLGLSVGKMIKDKQLESEFTESQIFDISSVLASAGLIHDIGNPPFGHFGETSIRDWFKENLRKKEYNGKKLIDCLKDEQMIKDFENFEGNAQALRLLTKLHFIIDENGMNLTDAVLNTIIKYPRKSSEIKKNNAISYKKMGYFYSENDVFKEIVSETGTEGYRHPLAFLLEAADDIAYKSADIEDGCNKGKINYNILLNELTKGLKNYPDDKGHEMVDKLKEYYKKAKEEEYPNPDMYAIQRFRIVVQGFMMSSVTEAFIKNYHEIMNGTFEDELLAVSEANKTESILKGITSKYIFVSKDVVTPEIEGHKIITRLLDLFVDAVLSNDCEDTSTREGKLYSLISDNYRFVNKRFNHKENEQEYIYYRLLLVCDFICGMTDSYAKELYQKLCGISC